MHLRDRIYALGLDLYAESKNTAILAERMQNVFESEIARRLGPLASSMNIQVSYKIERARKFLVEKKKRVERDRLVIEVGSPQRESIDSRQSTQSPVDLAPSSSTLTAEQSKTKKKMISFLMDMTEGKP